MNVAYMIGALRPGGMEILLLNVFKNVSNAAYKPICIHRKGGELQNEFYETAYSVFQLTPKYPFDIFYLIRLRKLLKQEKIDIVHAQQELEALYAWIACWGLNIKLVLTFHGYDTLNKKKKNKLTAFIARKTDRNVFVSDCQRDYYTEKYGLSLNKQITVYNGISFEKLDQQKELTESLPTNSDSDALKMAMVGNFTNVRSQMFVCKFLKLLKNKNILFDFYFVGLRLNNMVWFYDDCVEYCQDNDLSDNVHFLGGRTDVPSILKQLDAFIYSSDHDTFGLAVIEAIASAVPVFVNDWEVMKEITENGKFATLYKSKDENDLLDKFMLFLQNKETYIEKAKQNSIEIRNHFSIHKHIQNLEKVYNSLL